MRASQALFTNSLTPESTLDSRIPIEGGGRESWRSERSGMAAVEGSSARGARSNEPTRAGQPEDHERDFVAHPHRRALARRAGEVRQVDDSPSAFPTMERGRRLGGRRCDAGPGDGGQQASQRRFNDCSGPCLGGRRKWGTREQAFGRSRGGFTRKDHCLSDAKGPVLETSR